MQYNADTSKKFHNRMTSIKEDNPRETETKEFATRTKELWVLDLSSEQVN